MTTLGFSQQDLIDSKAVLTATEIAQQPASWRRALENVEQQREALSKFLQQALAHPQAQVILTGAGSSAFIGKAVQPYLQQLSPYQFQEVATTDIVSNPQQYFAKDVPTLLVSFGRSGNSPESVGAYDLANQFLSQVSHLVITCNPEGKLCLLSQDKSNSYVLNMPPETHDGSFAMTSSFSSMMLSVLAVFSLQRGNVLEQYTDLCEATQQQIPLLNQYAKSLVDNGIDRIIYLGSGGLQGLAQEAALKMLELTAGSLMSAYDSCLGFRHGPKSMVNKQTQIVAFLSNNAYTRLYDLDLLNELKSDNIAKQVIAVSALSDGIQETELVIPGFSKAPDYKLLFPYIVFAQLFALHTSLSRGNTPDNPCPTGEVNRVVQGVIIHPFFDI